VLLEPGTVEFQGFRACQFWFRAPGIPDQTSNSDRRPTHPPRHVQFGILIATPDCYFFNNNIKVSCISPFTDCYFFNNNQKLSHIFHFSTVKYESKKYRASPELDCYLFHNKPNRTCYFFTNKYCPGLLFFSQQSTLPDCTLPDWTKEKKYFSRSTSSGFFHS
jgi:hypothetical protein